MQHPTGRAVVLAVLMTVVLVTTATRAWSAEPTSPDAVPMTTDEMDETLRQVAGTRQCWQRCGLRDCWRFDIAIPLWIPGVSGSFASGGIEIDVDRSVGDAIGDVVTDVGDVFGDITGIGSVDDVGDLFGVDDLDEVGDLFKADADLKFGFFGSIQAHKGKWTIAVDGFGASLGTGIDFRLTDDRLVDASFWTLIVRGAVKYEWFRRPVRMPWRGAGCVRASAVAGARYYGAGFEATLPEGIRLKDSEEWVDPIVGLDVALDLSRKFRLRAEGDIGGFGVGSDFAWWLILGLDWRFARHWTLMLAYAYLDIDYGSASDFAWNLHLQGPSLGIQFSF